MYWALTICQTLYKVLLFIHLYFKYVLNAFHVQSLIGGSRDAEITSPIECKSCALSLRSAGLHSSQFHFFQKGDAVSASKEASFADIGEKEASPASTSDILVRIPYLATSLFGHSLFGHLLCDLEQVALPLCPNFLNYERKNIMVPTS